MRTESFVYLAPFQIGGAAFVFGLKTKSWLIFPIMVSHHNKKMVREMYRVFLYALCTQCQHIYILDYCPGFRLQASWEIGPKHMKPQRGWRKMTPELAKVSTREIFLRMQEAGKKNCQSSSWSHFIHQSHTRSAVQTGGSQKWSH